MTEENETCYFLAPGKLNKCSILNEQCTGTRSRQVCHFHKTEKEFFADRNRSIEINRKSGRCARCKYKSKPCEIIEIGGDADAAM